MSKSKKYLPCIRSLSRGYETVLEMTSETDASLEASLTFGLAMPIFHVTF